ncbi:MAG: hypothetical protein ACREDR_05750 [Blastocatellia bacterium]
MNRTLHIFRKDVRRLRWDILLVLGLMTAFVVTDSQASFDGNDRSAKFSSLLALLLELAWFYMIARVVQEEPLAKDVQFWVTRPYTWKSLLASKTLFVVAFICLPLLTAHSAILAIAGFDPGRNLPGLLCKQFYIAAVFLLPAVALAAVARGLVQFAGFTLMYLFYLTFLLYAPGLRADPDAEWMQDSILCGLLAGAALAVVYIQYAWRTTAASRAVLICAAGFAFVACLFDPWPATVAVYNRVTGEASDVVLAFDPDALNQRGKESQSPASLMYPTGVYLPIRVSGLPKDTDLDADLVIATLETPAGKTWYLACNPQTQLGFNRSFFRERDDLYVLSLSIDRDFFEAAKSVNVNLHLSLNLTVFRAESANQIKDRDARIEIPTDANLKIRDHSIYSSGPEIGPYPRVDCVSALRKPMRTLVHLQAPDSCIRRNAGWRESENDASTAGDWYSPYPAESALSPLVSFGLTLPANLNAITGQCPSKMVLKTERSVTHFRRDLEIKDLRLADYPTD